MTTLDCPGICLAFGAGIDSIEPDSRHYSCELCAVFGAEEVLLMIA